MSAIIPLFKQKGLKIGFVKHHHGTFYPREKLKDTGKMIQSGASRTLLMAEDEIVIEEPNQRANDDLSYFVEDFFTDCDLVLVEGFKGNKAYPKVLIIRHPVSDYEHKWYEKARKDANVIALIASPVNEFSDLPYPVFNPEDKEGFVEFILSYFNLKKRDP